MKSRARLRCTVPMACRIRLQQVKHGALLILAQFHNIGHSIRGTHEPDLRQYTHLGDGSVEDRWPYLRFQARSKRSEGRLLWPAG